MKESDIKKISLAEINRRMGICAQTSELSAILNTDDIEFLQRFMNSIGQADDLYQYIQYQIQGDESKIDKLSLILVTLSNYLNNYNGIVSTIRGSGDGSREEIKSRENLFKEYIEEAKKY